MLPKQERLKSSSEFSATYRLKKSVADSLLILYAGSEKKNPEDITKVGFVVSKKIHKRSTKRNRIKRLMRESYRQARKNGDIPENIKWQTLIYLARAESIDKEYKDIYKSVVNLFNKAVRKFD